MITFVLKILNPSVLSEEKNISKLVSIATDSFHLICCTFMSDAPLCLLLDYITMIAY